ncbi:peptidase C60 sortase A and B [Kribbella flavida DSM 17836]|uniref:Peptidase C60 sortase A and B n=1 Tax=Kribbella flavida (strain DSM 17836 / JCM 10339 / NBRC 14399) TaxID=479435 RepID=D2PZJ2_KRIFD|nr:peptidase C60 sortase A and B [Kribbella flavida DSM 17836]
MVLATGVVLVVAGGYLQFRPDDDTQQGRPASPAGLVPSAAPSSPAKSPAKPSTPAPGRPTTPGKPANQPSTPSTALPEATGTHRPAAGGPQRIVVPRLKVSARVLGIRANGSTLIPPANPRLVGWWSDGARPGAARGSAIITGHTVHTGGGAFDDLGTLRPGDAVSVATGRRTLRYSVVSVTTYRKRALAKQAGRLFDQTVPGRLVLVTCEDWNGTDYESNAVVIARPIG